MTTEIYWTSMFVYSVGIVNSLNEKYLHRFKCNMVKLEKNIEFQKCYLSLSC